MARYDPDHRGVGRWLLSREMEELLMPAAHEVAAKVRANTPRETGETVSSIRVETGHRDVKGDRVAVHVVAEGAMTQLEFGTKHQREVRPMRRAIE